MTAPPLHRRPVTAMAVAVLLALTLVGCGDDGGSADGTVGDDTAADAQPVALGEEVFQTNCASCHGADLDGTGDGPPLRHIVYEPGHHPDESFRRAIAGGVVPHHWQYGPMPAIEGLDDDEVDAVIAYVRHRQETDGFIQ
jgi:mono/diheme cytochrome c family protein